MTTDTTPKPDAALVAAGATPAATSETHSGNGPSPPPAPSNSPPVAPVDPAAEKAAADKAAADKVVADEAAKKAAEAENAPLDTAVWGSTGDEVGDSVLELIQNAGLSIEETKALMFDAVKAGDPTKIDRDALIEKVGKAKATLILAGVQNFITGQQTRAKTILTEVHTTVGGEANWTQLTAWAKTAVPEAELAEYRDMIDAGGAKARFAAAELATKFNADPKNTTLSTARTTEIIGDGVAQTTTRATTRTQYVAELDAAHKRGAKPGEIADINAARAAGRAKNI